MITIRIENLSKDFGTFKAVDNLSFEVKENKVFGFLGPNGAGKTTTIRMMVGLLKPSSGKIEITGQEIKFGCVISNNIFGYLPEQPSFYNWMSGSEYLSFVSDIFRIKGTEKREKISTLLKLVDLEESKNKKIGSYSSGMKQRLGIAQALISNSKVLILDEPVSALDPIGRRKVLDIIEQLKKDKTIFMSTHILSDVDRVCDDVAIINKGKLIIISPLQQLKSKYTKPILEVEFTFDPGNIVEQLKSEKWVKRFKKNGNNLKIWLENIEVAEKNLPMKFFSNLDVGILKYGFNLPETEDLFIELLENSDSR